jgi:prepilin-type processing-associated H-X9-DG protein
MRCSNNLKQLGLATHLYIDAYKVFPPQMMNTSTNNNRRWGWGTCLLPFVEQTGLYNALVPDGGNVIPVSTTLYNGVPLLQTPVAVYACPSDGGGATNQFHPSVNASNNAANWYTKSNYVGNQQLMRYRAGFGGPCFGMKDATDGTTNTLLIGERRLNVGTPGVNRYPGAVLWGTAQGTGDSANTFHAAHPINTPSTNADYDADSTDTTRTRFAISSAHVGGAQFAMADGSVRFVSENIPLNPAANARALANTGNGCTAGTDTGPGWVFNNLCSRNSNEVVGEF